MFTALALQSRPTRRSARIANGFQAGKTIRICGASLTPTVSGHRAMASLGDQYHEVAQRLGERIESLAPELLDGGHREGRLWRCGSVAGEPGQSLAVYLAGHRRGRWRDYAAAEGGDALDLVAAVKFAGDKRQAFAWARHWLALPEREPVPVQRRRPPQRAARSSRSLIERWWWEARPLRRGDPVDRYLCGRGIELARLGRAPPALRHHPLLLNYQQRRAYPAMLAAITGPDGGLVGLHRTWLAPLDGGGLHGAYGKAPIADRRGPFGGAKRSLGEVAGGAIRLWRGAIPDLVAIGEGIEDCLAAALMEPRLRVVCGVSLSLMLVLQLPAEWRRVLLLRQYDKPGSDADRLFPRVVQRFRDEGRLVGFAAPPAYVKDLAELAFKQRFLGAPAYGFDLGFGGDDDGRRQ